MLDLIPTIAISAGTFIGGGVIGLATARVSVSRAISEREWAIAERDAAEKAVTVAEADANRMAHANLTLRGKLRAAVHDVLALNDALGELQAKQAARSANVAKGNATRAAKRRAAK